MGSHVIDAPGTILKTALAVGAAALTGRWAANPGSAWYRRLRKPPWQPPERAFGLVWTPLYALIVYGGARASAHGDDGQRAALSRALAANLLFNAAWPVLFFRLRAPRLALAELLALNASNLVLIRRALAADRPAGLLLTPYAGWTVFATALNASLWRRNRTTPAATGGD
ncbi:TspO/MBR family protein [Sphaerimonospora sp. CA-214678]|uniref:TspO/MBR family protein n=1 Tax=Sphaerimonospora sp. CA-214678 TaxID=3240029 RepID=UPI003D925C23